MPPATDLDELRTTVDTPPLDGLDAGEPAPPRRYVRVCDKLTSDGAPCGETFDEQGFPDSPNPAGAARSAYARHVRFEHPKDGDPADAPKSSKSKSKAKSSTSSRPSSPKRPPRAEQYQQSLATIALGLYLGVPAFDEFDYGVLNAGTPMLAGALADIAGRHGPVGEVLDMVLAGGAGSPYVALVLASLAIGVPIAAHHGWLPEQAGVRFGSIIGIAAVPPAATPPPPAEPASPEPATSDTDTAPSFESWGDPATPAADATPRTGDGPTVVTLPDGVAAAV